MKKNSILIVEDNLLVADAVKDILTDEGYDAECAGSAAEAKKHLAAHPFHLCLLDMMLPDGNGRDLIGIYQKNWPDMMIVMMTAHGDVQTAVECLRRGACDFLTKPVEKPLLLKTISNALRHMDMVNTVSKLTELNKRETAVAMPNDVIANSPVMKKTLEMAALVAKSDFSCILIKGESGTGKGLMARTIHKMSSRADKPFVEVNCSALPANLIESELFGHKRGAFTDAKEDKAGLFELADSGTIFLDEIGDMDISLQAKLLKAIEEQKFRRIGGTSDITVNVAVIAATNQHVEELVKEQKFRLDLYYRLNVIPIELSPLRDRPEDIEALAAHYLRMFARKFGKNITGFSKRAMNALLSYSWPGNVREFRNAIERGCILTQGNVIDNPEILFPFSSANLGTILPLQEETPDEKEIPAPPVEPTADGPVKLTRENFPVMTLAEAEKLVIGAALRDTRGNKNKAAALLGMHRTTLYKKIEEYKLA